MIKKIVLIVVLSMGLFLIACSNKEEKPEGIFISKYYNAYKIEENAIEIYNPTQKTEDLSKYTINIYPNGDQFPEYTITLEGSLEPQSYYVIAHSRAENESLLNQADLKSPNLNYNGNDAIELLKDGKKVDALGVVGNAIDFAKETTLIRKDNYQYPHKNYNEYSYMFYQAESYQYLKNRDYLFKTNEDMLKGPTLNQADIEQEGSEGPKFIDPNNPNLGGGGAIKVDWVSTQDGDTATFRDKAGVSYRVRFAYIDTREVIGSGSKTGQDWGYPASAFTKRILNFATEFYIQSIKGEGLLDQYDRYLGLVWANGELVNFMVARAGLSDVNISNVTKDQNNMAINNVPYHAFLVDAVSRAKANKWSFFGEEDPYWDYKNNQLKSDYQSITFVPDKREYNAKNDK